MVAIRPFTENIQPKVHFAWCFQLKCFHEVIPPVSGQLKGGLYSTPLSKVNIGFNPPQNSQICEMKPKNVDFLVHLHHKA
jgi:hypothetical protein